MEPLSLKINGKNFIAEYDKDSIRNIIINGKPYDVELMKRYNNRIYAFSVNNRLMQIDVEINEHGESRITHDGFTHYIEISNETKKLLKQYINHSASGNSSGLTHIKAPMPGMIIKIHVEPGMTVNKGDKLLIIEAMKMENAIKSPVDGVIKVIKCKEGSPVDKDALLIEIDSEG